MKCFVIPNSIDICVTLSNESLQSNIMSYWPMLYRNLIILLCKGQHINGLAQGYGNSNFVAVELGLSGTEPSLSLTDQCAFVTGYLSYLFLKTMYWLLLHNSGNFQHMVFDIDVIDSHKSMVWIITILTWYEVHNTSPSVFIEWTEVHA